MKETTIHLFPVLDETNHSTTVFLSEEYYKMAKTLDFIPDSLETVKAIDRSELTLLMMVNDSFYNAVLIQSTNLLVQIKHSNSGIFTTTLRGNVNSLVMALSMKLALGF